MCEYNCNPNESKVNNLISNANVCPGGYNGSRKIQVEDKNFMALENVIKAMKEIKLKTSEGCDRIPQSVLLGGLEKMSILFQKIYLQKKIPEQWLMSDKSIIRRFSVDVTI